MLLLRNCRLFGSLEASLRHGSSLANSCLRGVHQTACLSGTVDANSIEFPGGSVPLVPEMQFVGSRSGAVRIPCYRTLDNTGNDLKDAVVPYPIDKTLALTIYETMVKLQTMDTLFYEAQRQGRFSFYMTSLGEEATVIGSAAALDPKDTVFAQYREQGVLLWRGFTLRQCADQCYGNNLDRGKGRQMPVHYGSKELHFHTISSPLATQLPHAVGAAYALKLSKSPNVAVAYFGEGAASEGDFHAAMNFAATLAAPCVFICRNNGYAISTPATEQYKGDGIAARGPSYGIPTIRVDGGDTLAVYNAVSEARRMAKRDCFPVLVEAMSYRSGHHSTSDDSSRYRTADEMRSWRSRDPVVRFRNWLLHNGWWDSEREQAIRKDARQKVVSALEEASKVPKPALTEMFTDVYSSLPWNLQEQMQQLEELVKQHPEVLPPDMPVK